MFFFFFFLFVFKQQFKCQFKKRPKQEKWEDWHIKPQTDGGGAETGGSLFDDCHT